MYRPFVTFPDGYRCFMPLTVRTEAERQQALAVAGNVNVQRLGTLAQGLPPQRVRELAAKVEFFKVAIG